MQCSPSAFLSVEVPICIILFAVDQHPDYPLVVAANRDEFETRPTEPLHRWSTTPRIWAGRDKSKSGTWMGVSESGRLAMVTNFRKVPEPAGNLASRGELPLEYLMHKKANFDEHLKSQGTTYGPVNLLWGLGTELHFWSNQNSRNVVKVGKGVHGLSNAFLNTAWPKVERGKKMLSQLLNEGEPSFDSLFEILNDQHQAKDEDLPQTGIPVDWERALSSIKIPLVEGYGSLTSTVLRMSKNGKMEICERHHLNGEEVRFSIESGSPR